MPVSWINLLDKSSDISIIADIKAPVNSLSLKSAKFFACKTGFRNIGPFKTGFMPAIPG